jgi:hypothetical protein
VAERFDRWLKRSTITDERRLFVLAKHAGRSAGATPVVVVRVALLGSIHRRNDEHAVIRDSNVVADCISASSCACSHYLQESLRFKDNTTPPRRKRKHRETTVDHGEARAATLGAGTDRSLRRLYFSGQ